MPGSLQNKLQQLEIAPPPAVWDKISARLDQEFVPEDLAISAKLDNASAVPPPAVWDKIAEELSGNTQEEIALPAKIRSIHYGRITAAAALIGLIAFVSFYFLTTGKKEVIVKAVPSKVTPPPVVPPAENRQQPTVPPPAEVQKDEQAPAAVVAKTEYKRPRPRILTAKASEPEYQEEYLNDPEQAPLYELHTVSAFQPVSVSGPLLRDKKGNVILDLSMISNPNDKYITVTGPNGKQTRISNKFLSCLGYINEGLASSGMDARAERCQIQFEQWRKKILDEPAFIPTANNFFDIFELKDLIEEL